MSQQRLLFLCWVPWTLGGDEMIPIQYHVLHIWICKYKCRCKWSLEKHWASLEMGHVKSFWVEGICFGPKWRHDSFSLTMCTSHLDNWSIKAVKNMSKDRGWNWGLNMWQRRDTMLGYRKMSSVFQWLQLPIFVIFCKFQFPFTPMICCLHWPHSWI